MESKSKEQAKTKKPRTKKIQPEVTLPDPDPGYFEVKSSKQNNPIEEIWIEINYKPSDPTIPFSFKLGAKQKIANTSQFDEEANRLYARLIAKIDDLRPE